MAAKNPTPIRPVAFALLFLAGAGTKAFATNVISEGENPSRSHTKDQPSDGTCELSSSSGGPSLKVVPIPRISALDVTTDEFRERYLSPPGGALPVHIVDSRGVDPADWTRSRLKELCGDAPLVHDSDHSVKYVHPDPGTGTNEWGGLGTADLVEWNISTWGELMDAQDGEDGTEEGREGGRRLYLHDHPITRTCPKALDVLPGQPKYFLRDYSIFESIDDRGTLLAQMDRNDRRFWDEFAKVDHFPSIFIGKGGGSSGSRLHSDVGLTRAYMLHLSGRKVWRLAAPSDRLKLGPLEPWATFGTPGASIFSANLFEPNFKTHPQLDGMTIYEGIAEPGDIVFFPEGWPHQVTNLDDTIAVSVNFVDNGNLEAVGEYNEEQEGPDDHITELAASLLTPLDDPPFPDSEMPSSFLPFRDYYRAQVIRSMRTVPSTVRRLVEDMRRNNATLADGDDGVIRDRFGDTILHDAALYGHVPALRYLLEEGGMDPNVMDECGRTPLHNANWFDRAVHAVLTEHGGEDIITEECEEYLNSDDDEDDEYPYATDYMKGLLKQVKMMQTESTAIET